MKNNMLLSLTQDEKNNIDVIHKNLVNGNYKIPLKKEISPDEVIQLYQKYRMLHPEMVVADICHVRWQGLSDCSRCIILDPKVGYNKRKNKICEFDFNDVKYLNERCDNILRDLNINEKKNMAKATAIYNYLSTHIVYSQSDNAYDAWGAIVDGKAVCNGTAFAYQLLAQKCGLNVCVVTGTLSGGAHAWNMIQIDGAAYHLDVTSNMHSETEYNTSYDFIFLTDDDMKVMNYSWEEKHYPICNSTKHNYFFVMKSYAKTVHDVLDIMYRQMSTKHLIYLRAANNLKLDRVLIDNCLQDVCKRCKMIIKSYSIHYNRGLNTVLIKYYL